MVTCKEMRAAIIALHKNGFTGKDIVATKIAPKSTIYRIIKNFKERGSILVKKASGRPRKSRKRQDRLLKRIQLRDRSATSAELAQEWQQAGVSASASTVRQRFLEDGLVSRRAAKKPLLSKKNIRDRLIFCKKYGEWTAEDWGKVIFSDEASFRLFGASGKRLVRRSKDMELDSAMPQLYKLFSLVATIGATSAGVERSFSCLKRLKSYTRNTMGQGRLSSLALLAIERTLVKSLEKTPSWNQPAWK
ncbi:zinc finger MYM-type 1-like protein [Labeo rohita]|uniref:Zinc finger MYM-type 1-like protein n=1 Tax=Labeo rohita TaxID=84645 RepID=A0A498L875_LABRO|nr:zinc finger MYM-type 1-like protein [Labeo rohita]